MKKNPVKTPVRHLSDNTFRPRLKKLALILGTVFLTTTTGSTAFAKQDWAAYEVGDTASETPSINLEVNGSAAGIYNNKTGESTLNATIKSITATTYGDSANSTIGVWMAQSNSALNLGKQTITVTDTRAANSVVYSGYGSGVTLNFNDTDMTTTAQTTGNNTTATNYGFHLTGNSTITLENGADIAAVAQSTNDTAGNVQSYGVYGSSGTNLTIDGSILSSVAQNNGSGSKLDAVGIRAGGGTYTIRNGSTVSAEKKGSATGSDNAYAISVTGTNADFTINGSTITATAKGTEEGTYTGSAVGIHTNPDVGATFNLQNTNVQATGGNATAIYLQGSTMTIDGGKIQADAYEKAAGGVQLHKSTYTEQNNDVSYVVNSYSTDVTEADTKEAYGINAQVKSTVTSLNGDITVASVGQAFGIEASEGSTVTKQGGTISVTSTGDADRTSGLQTKGGINGASTVTFGNDSTRSTITVTGKNNTYGTNGVYTDTKSTTTLKNTNVTVMSTGTTYGVYNWDAQTNLNSTTISAVSTGSGSSASGIFNYDANAR